MEPCAKLKAGCSLPSMHSVKLSVNEPALHRVKNGFQPVVRPEFLVDGVEMISTTLAMLFPTPLQPGQSSLLWKTILGCAAPAPDRAFDGRKRRLTVPNRYDVFGEFDDSQEGLFCFLRLLMS